MSDENIRSCGKLPGSAPARFKCWVYFDAKGQDQAVARVADWRRGAAAAKIFEMDDRTFNELWPGISRLLGVL